MKFQLVTRITVASLDGARVVEGAALALGFALAME
jgi:hypothetical protein